MDSQGFDPRYEMQGLDDSGSLVEHVSLEDMRHPWGNMRYGGTTASSFGGCDRFLLTEEHLAAIRDCALDAELMAIEELDANCVPSHRAVRSYMLRAQYGTARLGQLNWIRDDVNGQTRFKNTVDFPIPVRVIFASGQKANGEYRVCRKGMTTRVATRENAHWVQQENLFGEVLLGDPVQNYFVLVDTIPLFSGGWWISIRIGLPVYLSESGTRMEIFIDRIVFSSLVNLGIDNRNPSWPLVESAEVEISDLDESNSAKDSQPEPNL